MGVRVHPSLKRQVEALAEMEQISISDLVRRALTMHVAGGPSRWLELERVRFEQARLPRAAADAQPPDVLRYGEWMRSLAPEIRSLIHAVGEAAEFRYPHMVREIELFETSPIPIWCVALDQPVTRNMPVPEQVERIQHGAQMVTCNGAFEHLWSAHEAEPNVSNGAADPACAGSCCGHKPVPLTKTALVEEFVRSGYRLNGTLLHGDGTGARGEPAQATVVHMFGQTDDGTLNRIWGMEFQAPDYAGFQINGPAEEAGIPYTPSSPKSPTSPTPSAPAPPSPTRPRGTRHEGR